MTPGITVRPAAEADARAACDVLRRSIRELCVADHGHDEAVLAAWLANKTPANVLAWITSPSSFSVVGAGKLMLRALEEHAARSAERDR